MISQTHPSYLALDRVLLNGESSTPPALRQHLLSCGRCTDYLSARRAVHSPDPLPQWLAKLTTSSRAARPASQARSTPHRSRWPGASRRVGTWLWASAAAVLLVLLPPDPAWRGGDDPAEVRTKGVPTVAVYVKRDDRVWLWDGQASLHPGDRLRLKLIAAGYQYVAIGAPSSDPRRLRLLYSGALTGHDELLPASWVVDAQPEPEVLHVYLSHRPLPNELRPPPWKLPEPGWSKTLVMPKSTRAEHVP